MKTIGRLIDYYNSTITKINNDESRIFKIEPNLDKINFFYYIIYLNYIIYHNDNYIYNFVLLVILSL